MLQKTDKYWHELQTSETGLQDFQHYQQVSTGTKYESQDLGERAYFTKPEWFNDMTGHVFPKFGSFQTRPDGGDSEYGCIGLNIFQMIRYLSKLP